jgi:hypothetical protein
MLNPADEVKCSSCNRIYHNRAPCVSAKLDGVAVEKYMCAACEVLVSSGLLPPPHTSHVKFLLLCRDFVRLFTSVRLRSEGVGLRAIVQVTC